MGLNTLRVRVLTLFFCLQRVKPRDAGRYPRIQPAIRPSFVTRGRNHTTTR